MGNTQNNVYNQLKMRFKVTMINDLGKTYDETVIANNENEGGAKSY